MNTKNEAPGMTARALEGTEAGVVSASVSRDQSGATPSANKKPTRGTVDKAAIAAVQEKAKFLARDGDGNKSRWRRRCWADQHLQKVSDDQPLDEVVGELPGMELTRSEAEFLLRDWARKYRPSEFDKLDALIGRHVWAELASATKDSEPATAPAADEQKAEEEKGRLPLLKDAPGTKPPALRLVKGILRQGGMSLWVGAPDAGKTTVLFDMTMHIAHGLPWFGRKVDKGPALFCAFERADDVQGRLDAFYRNHPDLDRAAAPFRYVDLDGRNLDDKVAIQSVIDAAADTRTETGHLPRIIVVDTMAAALTGDENDSAVIGKFLFATRTIRRCTRAHVACSHHFGKDASRGPRGSSKLSGDFDAIFTLDKGTIVPTKLKGGKDWRIHYTVDAVNLYWDEDGDVVQAVTLGKADAPTIEPSSRDGQVLAALTSCQWVPAPSHLRSQTDKVALSTEWTTAVAATTAAHGKDPRDLARKHIEALLQKQGTGLQVDGDYVWFARNADAIFNAPTQIFETQRSGKTGFPGVDSEGPKNGSPENPESIRKNTATPATPSGAGLSWQTGKPGKERKTTKRPSSQPGTENPLSRGFRIPVGGPELQSSEKP